VDRTELGLFSTLGPVETLCCGTPCSSGCKPGTTSASQLLRPTSLSPIIDSDFIEA
jgi:hypothetical protein